MANPHVLVIPYPAQGHVIPLSELSGCLAKHESLEDRAKPGKFSATIAQVTPGKFEELIEEMGIRSLVFLLIRVLDGPWKFPSRRRSSTPPSARQQLHSWCLDLASQS
ncbi:hypothetical protein ACFX1S_023955 [Malus domestica]